MFRHGLSVSLQNELDLEVVGEASSVVEAREIARNVAPDVAIVDIMMPSISGITLTSELRETHPRCRTLGLSLVDDPGLIADMLRVGASGYACKTQPIAEILEAIRCVLGGVRYLPPTVSRDAVEAELAGASRRPLERLTPREREVFELLIRGHRNDEIATQLFISRRTVETHRQRIMNKLSAHSIAQMQRVAARYGGLTS
ncbi:MAG: response regulator transcription factor [Deltaproteobacteria bacterium]|nr:response regulator transcription factor [Deltaproteobacteria bacterium]